VRDAPLRILALDCATKTGWAAGARNPEGWKLVESGVQVFDVKRGESPGMRYLRFSRWLVEVFDLARPDFAIYEKPIIVHKSSAAAEVAHGFATRLQEICAQRGVEHETIAATSLKKAITGRGNAEKPEMMQAAFERWNKRPSDDNEGDALCLLTYAIKNYG
jgi:Holliday junction resolvasome RuvABC endonuclease subunit